MTNDQPDKRTRPELPKDSFGDFQYRQACVLPHHIKLLTYITKNVL